MGEGGFRTLNDVLKFCKQFESLDDAEKRDAARLGMVAQLALAVLHLAERVRELEIQQGQSRGHPRA